METIIKVWKMKDKIIILKTLVGSQAHGLADKNSDYDYRGVFVQPTSEILSLGANYKPNSWFEGKEDQTLYEIGHFLHLATKCNPSILEVFKAPIVEQMQQYNGENTLVPYDKDQDCIYKSGAWFHVGSRLRDLFPYVWNPNDAFNAFVGYSSNQRKKLLDKKDDRGPKFACAYLRTLYNLEQLLSTGNFTLDVTHNKILFERLTQIRNGNFSVGGVIDEAENIIEKCKLLRDNCSHKPDLQKINTFLLNVRKMFWT